MPKCATAACAIATWLTDAPRGFHLRTTSGTTRRLLGFVSFSGCNDRVIESLRWCALTTCSWMHRPESYEGQLADGWPAHQVSSMVCCAAGVSGPLAK
jgi:hypothetical protein